MPRRRCATGSNYPVDHLLDSELCTFAAASSALLLIRSEPFGRDAGGRSLACLARHWSGKASPISLPRLWNKKTLSLAATKTLLKRFSFATARWILVAHLAFILSSSMLLVMFKRISPPATTLMLYRKLVDGWTIVAPRYIPLEKIPESTRNMVLRVEDSSFYNHHGILPAAIKNAYQLNKRFGAPIYGGSTITMQTARTIFLIPAKSYFRKYIEVIIALEMEAILGKNRILELYFNYAEWGKGVFGVDAAARYHYKKGVRSLSRDQAIRLVTLLSSPIRYTPYSFGKNGILKTRYDYLSKRF